ncbi:MAG: acetoacetate--CoA ligase [Acidobacteriota bacterium]
MAAPLWTPSAARVAAAHRTRFHDAHANRLPPARDGETPAARLQRWSIESPDAFWTAAWRDADVVADGPPGPALADVGAVRLMWRERENRPNARWFPEARLSFAENLLRHGGPTRAGAAADPARDALVAWHEGGAYATWSYGRLYRTARRIARWLGARGVAAGDRVAAVLPNLPETVAAMLGAAEIGATWASCSPDFGVQGMCDRFGQIEPTVLFAVDGYRYGGRVHDRLDRLTALAAQLPSVQHIVVVPYARDVHGHDGDALAALAARDPRVTIWTDIFADDATTVGDEASDDDAPFPVFPFDHPLYVLFSSGTTGLPKCMVHGAGGTLLQHRKEHRLHTDLRADDVFFYFTTCGWMMWNWLVSGLAEGATLVLYDGAPMKPDVGVLWRMAAATGTTIFGTSAKYLALLDKEGATPAADHDLGALRAVLSTGSPLLPETFDYVYRAIGRDLHLASISGGTDIVSCFALGDPTAPVHRGALQAPGLGMAVAVLRPDGSDAAVGETGELACTQAFPSMPVAFWNDPDGERYRRAYFDVWPGIWRHGDWIQRTAENGFVISGRADATLNPGGVRIGTAEIYRQVEAIDAVLEALVVGQTWGDDDDVRVVLFVRLRDDATLDAALEDAIRRRVREGASPHHVPRKIVAVADLPRTRSGKITELAVRDVIHGRPVANVEALANPEALELFRDLPALRQP